MSYRKIKRGLVFAVTIALAVGAASAQSKIPASETSAHQVVGHKKNGVHAKGKAHPGHPRKQADAKQNNAQTAAIAKEQVERSPLDCCAEEEKRIAKEDLVEQRRMAVAAEYMAWLTGGVVLISIFQGLLMVAQTLLLKRAWNASTDTVAIMKDTGERQLRAYLAITGISADPIVNGETEVRILFKNCGQTPAHHVRLHVNAHFIMIEKAMFPLADGEERFAIGPGVDMTSKLTCIMAKDSPDMAEKIARGEELFKAGAAALYAYGELRYRDAFYDEANPRSHVERVTAFRAMLTGEKAIAGGKMAACKEGNYAT